MSGSAPARLRGRTTFAGIHGNGLRARRGAVSVLAQPRDDSAPARVGYAIPRRVGNAVTRNRLRRRLRAAVAHAGVAPGWDCLVSGGGAAVRAGFADLVQWLDEALGALGASGARGRDGKNT